MARYAWVAKTLTGVVARPPRRPVTRGDRLDRVLTHRSGGPLIFAADDGRGLLVDLRGPARP